MSTVAIIGGGICGLSSARYLVKAGWNVTVLDKGDYSDNCSYGNAGFVCPSHYIQLASPGIVKQGIKWMFNSRSPFYIQPRLNKQLIGWGLSFLRSASNENIEKHGVPLRNIGLLSQHEYENVWQKEMDIAYSHRGMLEIFQSEAGRKESAHIVEFGKRLGLEVALIDADELSALEPNTKINAIGAVNYKCDGSLSPVKLMSGLKSLLLEEGVKMIPHAEVKNVVLNNRNIQKIITSTGEFEADAFVLAAGSWSGDLASKLELKMPVVGGRGYSVTVPVDKPQLNLLHPGILVEGRCAFTPIEGDKIRFGGTMEITALNTPPRYSRVQGILNAVHDFFPEIDIPYESVQEKIWYGFRPVSGDGMPYIGRPSAFDNLAIATGHSQLGISLGAATGLLVKELLQEEKPSVDLSAFSVDRFA